jgi:hypothetical protein
MRVTGTAIAAGAFVLLNLTAVEADQHGRGAGAATHGAATKSTSATKGSTPSGTTTTSTGGTTTTSTPPNPIATKISSKPHLNSKIATMLPKGMTLDQASRGFKNQGQFIAALHVSQNLGIPFKDLKNDMTVKHLSLGQSIQDLKPTAHSSDEARKGETAANHDLEDPRR